MFSARAVSFCGASELIQISTPLPESVTVESYEELCTPAVRNFTAFFEAYKGIVVSCQLDLDAHILEIVGNKQGEIQVIVFFVPALILSADIVAAVTRVNDNIDRRRAENCTNYRSGNDNYRRNADDKYAFFVQFHHLISNATAYYTAVISGKYIKKVKNILN